MADGGTFDAPVLAVEDEALLAFDLEDMLHELGFRDVTVCGSYADAEAALAARAFGYAIFDLNLDGRMSTPLGFSIAWLLSSFGIIHLAAKVNEQAAYLAAITLAIYIFIYTPMKRASSFNTLVGAIPGAIPPMIGWAAAGGNALTDVGSWILFTLLFFWQLPHFVAINWLCREEYEEAGYKMWANGDFSGKRTAWLASVFSLILAATGLWPAVAGYTAWWAAVLVCIAGLVIAWLSMGFRISGERTAARRLFFSTLIYLPLALGLLAIAWT